MECNANEYIGRVEREAVKIPKPKDRLDFYRDMSQTGRLEENVTPQEMPVAKEYFRLRIEDQLKAFGSGLSLALHRAAMGIVPPQ